MEILNNRQSATLDQRVARNRVDEPAFTMEEAGLSFETATDNEAWIEGPPEPNAAEKFLKLASMTLAERIRYFYLEDRDLTENDVEAMAEKDRAALEEEIHLAIINALGFDDTGSGHETFSESQDIIASGNVTEVGNGVQSDQATDAASLITLLYPN